VWSTQTESLRVVGLYDAVYTLILLGNSHDWTAVSTVRLLAVQTAPCLHCEPFRCSHVLASMMPLHVRQVSSGCNMPLVALVARFGRHIRLHMTTHQLLVFFWHSPACTG